VYDSMLALPRGFQNHPHHLHLRLHGRHPCQHRRGQVHQLPGPQGSGTKARVATAAGILFLIAGMLGLLPPSWTAQCRGLLVSSCPQRDGPGRDKGRYKKEANTTTNPASSQGTSHV
ncbi:unnamed protein product, partial [Coregonus sp. 'balchen']